jgi:aurora kinase
MAAALMLPPFSAPMKRARYPETLLDARAARAFSLADFTIPRKGGGLIGTGRFGQVLKVQENASRRMLVLKRVSKQALVDEGAVRQFQREVEVHARLQHEHIIRMYAYFHDAESCAGARGGQRRSGIGERVTCVTRFTHRATTNPPCPPPPGYLLLELAELGTLYNRIEAGRIPEREAALYFRQLVCAVAHLHARGVIHRDIKPENVFLARASSAPDAPSVVKLGDFGWAIVKRAASKRTTICGTMEYLPPEVCRGAQESIALNGGGLVAGASMRNEYDESFDLYTLGVLLYEMLVGHSPFAGGAAAGADAPTEAAMMARITAGAFAIPHYLPRELHMLIRQLMSAEPSARPTAADVLAHPWVVRLAGRTDEAAWR